MKKLLLLPFIFFSVVLFSQEKPKLVVGIIVDQMRQEYLYRFQDKYGEDGFKRLMTQGYNFKNAHYNYVPTYTAPGHASVYTGTTPAYHGIIGNDWYDKTQGKEIYCASDESVETVGSDSHRGKMSPRNMLTTTISDQLILSSQKRSKVIGISIKDRGAIFPAGHMGEAYWHDKSTGDFITSTYYRESLPKWVSDFNKKKRPDYYLSQKWEPVGNLENYIESGKDNVVFEAPLNKDTPDFPYHLEKGDYWMVTDTPFGNDLLTELALSALENADLGTDNDTDLLAVSYSSTDYIGHRFGPNSKEVQDTYMRLDKNIAELLKALDEQLGKDNYLVFLTADHAIAEVPSYLVENNVPAGNFEVSQIEGLNAEISARFGDGKWIENITNHQVFINHQTLKEKKIDLKVMQEFVAQTVLKYSGVSSAYPAHVIAAIDFSGGGVTGMLVRGYNQKRSGDVLITLEPGWIIRRKTGSTHGSAYTYDAHVPLLWYGAGIHKGTSFEYKTITQIAPTLSMMLDVMLPNGATGQPLVELFNNN
ncbi:MAG: alkaline phosphatase PafA [Fulvivirga sp.]